MNKFFKSLLAVFIVAVMFVFTVPAQAGYDHYVINVYGDTGFATAAGGYTPITSGVRYVVFNGGGALTLSTIYSDNLGTAKSNPVEATTFNVLDRIDFYIDDSVTTVDIAIIDLTGYSLWLRGATTSTRTAIIDKKPGLHVAFIDWAATKASMDGLTGEQTDYITFESDIFLLPEFALEVITASCQSGAPQLQAGLAGTDAAWMADTTVDGAKIVSFISKGFTAVGDSRNMGSSMATSVACAADGGTYVDYGTAYQAATGASLHFSAASTIETGAANTSVTTDLENGWGFFHFWFYKIR